MILIQILEKKKQHANFSQNLSHHSIKKSKVLNMIFVTQKIFDQTWKLIQKYQDKEWSFTDASTFKIMKNFDIKYYLSYDVHFSQFPKIISWKAEPK